MAYVDPELVERLYVREGGTVSGVAAHLDSSVYAVRAILRDRHVVVRGRGHPAKNVNPLLNDADWLRAQYLDQQRTVKEIAAEVGHSDHAVKDRLRKLQIPLRTNRQVIEMRTQRRRAELGPEVERRYRSGESIETVAAHVGAGWETVRRILAEREVPVRSAAEAAALLKKPERAPSRARALRKAMREGRAACVVCGAVSGLHYHHRDADPSNNSDDNLVPLCADDHAMIEWFVRPVFHRWRQTS